ncbi:universal stress protein [Rhizobiaceae bacterium BDR2-2]|uniref:Universal stress protein n=1 Tax=Ectorhizobium quercum TaxID=2965071 RepID=A0AAE3SVN3_9HYPH|nr:universal stress protein [Ectorhizobium quercum]MCX8997853.1 universal stress protein [Ectorhizobium quercum]
MGYKTVLAVLDKQDKAGQITDFAVHLAETFSGHVIGLHVENYSAVPIVAPMEIPDPVAIEALQEASRAETGAIEGIFTRKADQSTATWEWRHFVSSIGFSSTSVIDSARAADLIVAAQGDGSLLSDNRSDIENFLFESGRPVLLVPQILTEPKPIRRVLLAWNGSREAARATFDALPFLKQAESVEIFSVNPQETPTQTPETAGAEIAAALARHGVNAVLSTHSATDLDASSVIENRLAESSIDLLVMGAYGHSRWRELLFGGVTRTLLESMTALTLLSR